ncbi:MAG: NAD(FAD)-dependent dehydrogenase [Frankiales bacterium]|nr:NAD(FAD)-dependent dehydrogenase [Frankiales bacterium]
MATSSGRTVVVGASLAGVRAAEELRRQGYDGDLVLVGAERQYPPTDRPPLSKELLSGAFTVEQAQLRVRPFEVTALLGRVATRLDLQARAVELDDESLVPFDDLVIATGTTPRLLPVSENTGGIHVLRTAEDCLAIRALLPAVRRVVVVGAGFVGCEVASTLRSLGVQVSLVEPMDTPLKRAFGAGAGTLVADLHRRNGVDLRLGVSVTGVVEEHGSAGGPTVRAIRLSDGTELECQLLVVAIGVVPSTDWLEGSGLLLGDGVVCDMTCTALDLDGVPVPGVVAAGDVARWHHPVYQRTVRVEHWTNAMEQGRHAARTLRAGPGGGEPYAAVPFFWSNQYEHLIQFVGLPGPEETEVQAPDGSRVLTYAEQGRLTGAFVVDGARLVRSYREQILAANADRPATAAAAPTRA